MESRIITPTGGKQDQNSFTLQLLIPMLLSSLAKNSVPLRCSSFIRNFPTDNRPETQPSTFLQLADKLSERALIISRMQLHPYDQCGSESGKEPSTQLSSLARKLLHRISAKGSIHSLIERKKHLTCEKVVCLQVVDAKPEEIKINRKKKRSIDICNSTNCFFLLH